MTRAGKSDLWYHTGSLQTGTVHGYYYMVNGARTGGSTDVPAYGPDSYPKPGVPKGTVSEKKTIASKLYPGSSADYWVYASPGVDPSRPAPLMVW